MWSHVPQYMTCHTWMLKSPWLGASLFLPRKRCIVQDCSSLALNTNARNACLKCPDLTLPNKAWYHWNWICLKLRAVVNVAVLEHSPQNHSVVEYTYSLNYQCSLSLVHCELASYSPTVKWAEFSSQCMSGQGHIITKKNKKNTRSWLFNLWSACTQLHKAVNGGPQSTAVPHFSKWWTYLSCIPVIAHKRGIMPFARVNHSTFVPAGEAAFPFQLKGIIT